MGKMQRYLLYELDMWGNSKDGWEENSRYSLGELNVPCSENGIASDKDILNAMKQKTVMSIAGIPCKVLSTRNRRKVYIEDYSGDGTWIEIGSVKGHQPIYGLKPIEDD